MYRVLSGLVAISFLLIPVLAQQTLTIPDPAGTTNSVVEVITVDPDTGEAVTSIISTIIPTATTTTPTVPNDPAPQGPGPVGAPPDTASLTGPPQIVYTYTTADGAGGKEVFTTTFVPTSPAPPPTAPLKSGKIWGFSEYTARFGSAPTQGGAANSLTESRPSSLMWTAICGVVAFGAGGMLLI